MEEVATQAVGDGRSCSGLASETKPNTDRLNRKQMALYGIRRRGDGHQTQKRGQPKRASTQQIAILLTIPKYYTNTILKGVPKLPYNYN
jgi:hypothetical protein